MVAGYSTEDAIKAILNWAEEEGNEGFDTYFVESVAEGLEEFGTITERQNQALENIIYRCEINIGDHL